MQQMLDIYSPFDTSPRFSRASASDFQRFSTASAIVEKERGSKRGFENPVPTSEIGTLPTAGDQAAAKLYEATKNAKVWTSQVAMHLDRAVRDRIFRQLDVLHDAEEWIDDGSPVNLESFKSCVRAIMFHHINRRPSLSLMPSGNLLALWQDQSDKLTIEFLPANKTRWMVQNTTQFGPERTASTAPLERLRDVLEPYGAGRWFDAA